MPNQSIRKHVHMLNNANNKMGLNKIDLNTDQVENLLGDIKTGVQHTVFELTHTASINPGMHHYFANVDIGATNGIYKFEIAGTIGNANMAFDFEVSHDGITFFSFPNIVTIIGTNFSATFDMVFRYHRLKVTNHHISTHSVNFIQAGRH